MSTSGHAPSCGKWSETRFVAGLGMHHGSMSDSAELLRAYRDNMNLHTDLLRQVQHLAVREPKRPLQASLRRAISASYYAIFHMLVDDATRRMFPGTNRASLRCCLARAFVHRDMKKVAQQFSNEALSPKLSPGLNGEDLPPGIINVATVFVDLQQARHEADYDTARRFTRREVLDLLDQAKQAFVDWKSFRRSIQADTFLAGMLAFVNMRT